MTTLDHTNVANTPNNTFFARRNPKIANNLFRNYVAEGNEVELAPINWTPGLDLLLQSIATTSSKNSEEAASRTPENGNRIRDGLFSNVHNMLTVQQQIYYDKQRTGR